MTHTKKISFHRRISLDHEKMRHERILKGFYY